MKTYRIVRIAGMHYDTPMLEFYAKDPESRFLPYAEQQKVLFDMAYTYSDSFSKGMRTLGHEAHEIVYDLEILQKKWAAEKGISYNPDCWQYEIILKQLDDLKPDIVFLQDIYSLPHWIRKNLKNDFPFIKLVAVNKGYPGPKNELDDTDVLFSGTPLIVEHYKDTGINQHLVYHSFDEAILNKISGNGHDLKYDFTFIGSSGYGRGLAQQARYWSLIELIQKTSLEAWIHDLIIPPKKLGKRAKLRNLTKKIFEHSDASTLNKILASGFLPSKLERVVVEVIKQKQEAPKQNSGSRVPVKPLTEMFPHRCYPPVFGIHMFEILRESKITLNKHVDAATDYIGNLRLFQSTGIGTCLLTDTGKNMPNLFAEDEEVVTYSCVNECIEKVTYLLEHDDVRCRIAGAGQKRTLKDHTTINRCRQIDEVLQKML